MVAIGAVEERNQGGSVDLRLSRWSHRLSHRSNDSFADLRFQQGLPNASRVHSPIGARHHGWPGVQTRLVKYPEPSPLLGEDVFLFIKADLSPNRVITLQQDDNVPRARVRLARNLAYSRCELVTAINDRLIPAFSSSLSHAHRQGLTLAGRYGNLILWHCVFLNVMKLTELECRLVHPEACNRSPARSL